jgi:hypothetical protein
MVPENFVKGGTPPKKVFDKKERKLITLPFSFFFSSLLV